ncbi:MAG: phosphate ABC transporter permease PstA [Actinomycetota bacterium]|nr:phosphate ABC transporter permease PstA [Actinomycetota bacterium]
MALTTPARTATTVTPDLVRRRLEGRRLDVAGAAFRLALLCALAFALLVLGVLLADVLTGGWSVLSTRLADFMTGTLRSFPGDAGIFQGLRGSLWIGIFVVTLAFPFGIGAAIYLEEYAPRSRLTRFIDINIRNLAGVPSIVYGLLGLAIFVQTLEDFTGGRSVIAGGITLAILVLPIVIITSAEAIRAVPNGLREAGFGVGSTRWEVIRHHVLPYAAPGILTGTVLSLARALGEAAPLILVGAVSGRLGSNPGLFDFGSLDQRFTAMPNVITAWASQPNPGFRANTAAAIVIMLVFVLVANAAAIVARNRFERKRS